MWLICWVMKLLVSILPTWFKGPSQILLSWNLNISFSCRFGAKNKKQKKENKRNRWTAHGECPLCLPLIVPPKARWSCLEHVNGVPSSTRGPRGDYYHTCFLNILLMRGIQLIQFSIIDTEITNRRPLVPPPAPHDPPPHPTPLPSHWTLSDRK